MRSLCKERPAGALAHRLVAAIGQLPLARNSKPVVYMLTSC